MSPSRPTRIPFSYDRTLKSLFAEKDVVRDLLDFHAAELLPDLQGFEPLDLVSASTVSTDPVRPPHHEETHRDTVWTLARGDAKRDHRALLHMEFQSRRDSRMSMRMVRYAYDLYRRLPELEVFGLVVNTGNRPFGTWWHPVQSVPGSHGYGFREGALLDIHDFDVPSFPNGEYPLPPESLVTGIVALARIQADIRMGGTDSADQILPLLRYWIIPRALKSTATLREAYGAWFKAGFDDLLADQPQLRSELRRITYIEETETVMNTFGNIIAAREQRAEARGLELGEARGEARGERKVLLQFVAQFWGDDEAERFARQLDGADRSRIPEITDLIQDQAEGRLPRLRQNGRTDSGR